MAPPSIAFSRVSLIVVFCLQALLAAGATSATAGARRLAMFAPAPTPAVSQRLADTLGEGEGPQQCWDALVEMKSCTGEIILFLLDGEAYLGPACCRAIRVVERRCWAADAVVSVAGFTPEEGDMLKGYCDAGKSNDGQLHGASSPLPSYNRAASYEDAVAVAREGSAAVGSMAGRKGSVHR